MISSVFVKQEKGLVKRLTNFSENISAYKKIYQPLPDLS
jgi:hypothetical protein